MPEKNISTGTFVIYVQKLSELVVGAIPRLPAENMIDSKICFTLEQNKFAKDFITHNLYRIM